MPKFKVNFTQQYTYECSHELEADTEEEAIEIVKSLDNFQLMYREECDSNDFYFEVEEID